MGQTAAGQPPDTTGQAAADRAYQAASSHTSGNSPSAVGPAGAGDQERSGPEAASEAMRLSDLLFEVDKSLRYHQRRRAHFERWHRWSMLAIVLLGSAAVARWEDSISLLGVPANAMLGLLTALIGALDLVYAPAIRPGVIYKCSALANERRGIVESTCAQAALHPGSQRLSKGTTGAAARSARGRGAGVGALRAGQAGRG